MQENALHKLGVSIDFLGNSKSVFSHVTLELTIANCLATKMTYGINAKKKKLMASRSAPIRVCLEGYKRE